MVHRFVDAGIRGWMMIAGTDGCLCMHGHATTHGARNRGEGLELAPRFALARGVRAREVTLELAEEEVKNDRVVAQLVAPPGLFGDNRVGIIPGLHRLNIAAPTFKTHVVVRKRRKERNAGRPPPPTTVRRTPITASIHVRTVSSQCG